MQINFENLTLAFLPRRPGSMWRPSGSTSAGPAAGARQALWQHSPLWRGDVTRVRFVKSAQRLGFSLDESPSYCGWRMAPIARKPAAWPAQAQGCAREDGRLGTHGGRVSELVCACHARKGNVSCPLIRHCKTERSSLHRRGGVTG